MAVPHRLLDARRIVGNRFASNRLTAQNEAVEIGRSSFNFVPYPTGSFAMLAAIRHASSLVSSLAEDDAVRLVLVVDLCYPFSVGLGVPCEVDALLDVSRFNTAHTPAGLSAN